MGRTFLLPLFPLPETTLFPGVRLPFFVFEQRYRKLLEGVLDGTGLIGFPMILSGFGSVDGGAPPLVPVFGFGRVEHFTQYKNGTSDICVVGEGRARILEELPSDLYRVARVEVLNESRPSEDVAAGLVLELAPYWKRLMEPLGEEPLPQSESTSQSDLLETYVHILITATLPRAAMRQVLLETVDLAQRAHELLKHFRANSSGYPETLS